MFAERKITMNRVKTVGRDERRLASGRVYYYHYTLLITLITLALTTNNLMVVILTVRSATNCGSSNKLFPLYGVLSLVLDRLRGERGPPTPRLAHLTFTFTPIIV